MRGLGIASVVMAMGVGAAAGLIRNGDFEKGLDGWGVHHPWYEQPKGGGQSTVQAVAGEGRANSTALRIEGKANRGLAMQVAPAYPGQYRVSGWLRAEGLGTAEGVVLCEWLDRKNTWMRGDHAGRITGTAEWTRFETTVTAPSGTRSIHFDLLTSAPNSGRVWFDDIAMERLPGPGTPPGTPSLAAKPGAAGAVVVTWDPAALAPAAVRLMLCGHEPGASAGLPWAIADAAAGQAVLSGLRPGAEVCVAARVADADGLVSAWSAECRVRSGTADAPRPGFGRAESADGRRVRFSWWPHPLSRSVATLRAGVEAADGSLSALGECPVTAPGEGPFYRSAPQAALELNVPAGSQRVLFQAVSADGQISPAGSADLVSPPAAGVALNAGVRFAPATANLPQQGELPVWRVPPELTLMRGQAKGFQVALRPAADLHRVRLEAADLTAEPGGATVPGHWVAWHAVRYASVEKNSRATPRAALVWPGPGLYPDELDDAPEVDLPRDTNSSLYVRIGVPRTAAPGFYRGQVRLLSAEGALAIPVRIRVVAATLPETSRIDFVYWFSWEDACKPFGVDPSSEDGWRVLAATADLMRVHRQNAVVVPWSLAHFWRLPDGRIEADFRELDRFVATFAERGVDRLFCISHMGGRTTGEWECPTMGAGNATVLPVGKGTAESVDVVTVLPLLEAHFRERGWLDRAAVHVADEPIAANLVSYRDLARRVHEAAPALRRIDAIHVPDLAGSLEIWVPQLNYLKQWHPQYAKAQADGATLWFYVAWVPQGRFPNRMIDCPAIKPRVLHWMHAVYGTTGYLHWALNRWSIPLSSLESPGDQYICWPSTRFIADSSLRYEAEREGLEDAELMAMLREALQRRGRTPQEAADRVREIIRPAVREAEDFTLDWSVLEEVRARLLDELGNP